MQNRTVDIGDAQLSVAEAGEGASLVFVPGFDGRAASWQAQLECFAASHRVVSFDQRGCGGSSHSAIRYSVRQMADDLLSLLDELQIDTATVIGHGPGSAIALQLAVGHSDRIDRLVLSAALGLPSVFLADQIRLAQAVLAGCGKTEYARLCVLRSAPASWLHVRPWWARDRAGELQAGLAEAAIEISRLQAMLECDLQPRVANIRIPTLIVAATDDQVVPHALSRTLAGMMPNTQLHFLPFGGHRYAEVAPDPFNDLLRTYLDESS